MGKEMVAHSWLSIVHFGEKTYMVDRGAYYLLCGLQKIKLYGESSEEIALNKTEMYAAVIDWLVDMGRAFQTSKNIHHLIIKLDERIE